MERKRFRNYQSRETWQALSALVVTVTGLMASWGPMGDLLQNSIWHSCCCHPPRAANNCHPPRSANFLPVTAASCSPRENSLRFKHDAINSPFAPQCRAGVQPRSLVCGAPQVLHQLVSAPELEEPFAPLSPIFGKFVGFLLPSRLGGRQKDCPKSWQLFCTFFLREITGLGGPLECVQ